MQRKHFHLLIYIQEQKLKFKRPHQILNVVT